MKNFKIKIWKVVLIFFCVAVPLVFLLLPRTSSGISVEKLRLMTYLSTYEEYVKQENIDDEILIINNTELCNATNWKINQLSIEHPERFYRILCGYIKHDGKKVFFGVHTGKDGKFSKPFLDFLRKVRERTPKENIINLKQLELNRKELRDIIIIKMEEQYED